MGLPGTCISVRHGLALTILGLRLRRPRDRWRRLVRQPGFVAGLMAALVLALRLIGFATMCVRVVGQPSL